MSWGGSSHVAGCPGAGGPRDALRPCDLYPAARPRSPGAAEPPPPLWPALSHGRAEPSGHRRGLQASGRGDWGPRRAPHLGSTTAPSSPPALCPPRGGRGPGWLPLGTMSATLLPARPRPLTALSTTISRRAGAAL